MSIKSIVDSGIRLMETTLLDRAWIQDRTMVRDTSGGRSETWVERPQQVACRFILPKDDDQILTRDSKYGPTQMIVTFPLDTPFKEGDRVRNARGGLWQITLDVTVPSELQVVMRAGIRLVG